MLKCFVLQTAKRNRIDFWESYGINCSDVPPQSFISYDILFFHNSDSFDSYSKIDDDISRWKVVYTAGSPVLDKIDQTKKIARIVSWETLQRNFATFAQIVEEKRRVNPSYEISIDDIFVLVGINPSLEAKLQLLHSLLIPPENIDVLESRFESLIHQYERAWIEFKDGDPSKYNSDPFNEDYLKLLGNLRDSLDVR